MKPFCSGSRSILIQTGSGELGFMDIGEPEHKESPTRVTVKMTILYVSTCA